MRALLISSERYESIWGIFSSKDSDIINTFLSFKEIISSKIFGEEGALFSWTSLGDSSFGFSSCTS